MPRTWPRRCRRAARLVSPSRHPAFRWRTSRAGCAAQPRGRRAQRCCLTATAALWQSSRHHRAPLLCDRRALAVVRPPRAHSCRRPAHSARAPARAAAACPKAHAFDLAPTHRSTRARARAPGLRARTRAPPRLSARATCPRPRTSPRTSMVRHWGELRESGSVARPHPRARPPPPTHTPAAAASRALDDRTRPP